MDPDDGGNKVLLIVYKYLPIGTVSYTCLEKLKVAQMVISITKLNDFSWSLGKFEGNTQHLYFIELQYIS
jgi:hypothetical protein